MDRIARMFEIIQILRASARPVKADDLADLLEVSPRTIYRDIAVLQSVRTPIEGAAGIGYVMRKGYDLPALNFTQEEIEALRVGLGMLARSGDGALQAAADGVRKKIDALQGGDAWLQVAPWGAPLDDPEKGCVSLSAVRDAIREARKMRLSYRDGSGGETVRIIRPVGIIYHIEAVIIAGWCELRKGFRHFRADRIEACEMLDEHFTEQAEALRSVWLETEGYDGDRRG